MDAFHQIEIVPRSLLSSQREEVRLAMLVRFFAFLQKLIRFSISYSNLFWNALP